MPVDVTRRLGQPAIHPPRYADRCVVAAPLGRYTEAMSTNKTTPGSPPPDSASADVLSGRLHVYVAFDWGEEIDLDRARQQGAGVVLDMIRRPRTPVSIAYRPPPLRFPLGPVVIA